MVKKVHQIVNVSEKWIQITDRIIEGFISQNQQLEKNKRIKLNLAVCLYIVYDMLYKHHIGDELLLNYYTINYDSLRAWSSLGNNFFKFFRYLLDKHYILRWESETINPKTNKPYPYYYHCKGITGSCAQYRLNPKIIKAIQNQPEVGINLTISQKNDYFFHTVSKCKKKLNWWKKNDVYQDYREPNEYELKIMDRMKYIQIPDECILQGDIQPIFIHGRIYRNGWTNLSKEIRPLVKYKGQLLKEVFDVRNCYVQFTAAKLEELGQVKPTELQLFSEKAYSGKFYQFLAEGTKYTRDDMKKPWMHYLFSSNGTKIKGIKNHRNILNGVAQPKYDQDYVDRWNIIVSKMKQSFSSIHKLLSSYQQISVGGRKISKISVELQWLENKYVLNGLMKRFEQTGYIKEPVSLHDAVYLTEDQVDQKMINDFQTAWNVILNKHIRKINVVPVVQKSIQKPLIYKQLDDNQNVTKECLQDYYDNYYYFGKVHLKQDYFKQGSNQYHCWNILNRALSGVWNNLDCRHILNGDRIQGEKWQSRRDEAKEHINIVRDKCYKAFGTIYDKYGKDVLDSIILTVFKDNDYMNILTKEIE